VEESDDQLIIQTEEGLVKISRENVRWVIATESVPRREVVKHRKYPRAWLLAPALVSYVYMGMQWGEWGEKVDRAEMLRLYGDFDKADEQEESAKKNLKNIYISVIIGTGLTVAGLWPETTEEIIEYTYINLETKTIGFRYSFHF